MCGIYGIWNRDGAPVDLASAQRATTIIRHRGPDDEGYLLVNTQSGRTELCGGPQTNPVLHLPSIEQFLGQSFDLALGFRRLAILDLSPAGHQPMHSADERFWLIFNGEIYNYLDLRTELSRCGYTFRSSTDSEVILAAYQEWEVDCLKRFNGMFAFALWDMALRTLVLARDHFGIKPLCYAETGKTFRFASEQKALVGSHGVSFVPEDEAVYRYLAWGVLPGSKSGDTFFQGVKNLLPGCSLTLTSEENTQRSYWNVTRDLSPHLSPERAVEEYGALFADAVRLQLQADVPVGTCLSGGVDSSAIVGEVNRLMRQDGGLATVQVGERQKTFSAVYRTSAPFNERSHIDRMVAHTGVDAHFTFPSLEKLLEDLDRLIWHQDEPFQGTSTFAQWCVMQLVRESGVIVLLDGQGADETLAGYSHFGTVYLAETARRRGMGAALGEARAIQSVVGLSMPGMLRTMSLLLPPRLRSFLVSLEDRALHRRQITNILNVSFRVRYEGRAARPSAVNYNTLSDYTYAALFELSLPHLLRYEDRNSMAFSVESRVPFLDYRLVNYTFGSASNWRLHNGWTKWVLRQAVSDLLPPEIAWRRDKVGFATPESEWLDVIGKTRRNYFTSDSPAAAYLDVEAVRRTLDTPSHTAEEARRRWRWINLESWLRQGQAAG